MSSPGKAESTHSSSGKEEEISQTPFQRVLEWSMAPTEVGKDDAKAKKLDDLRYMTVSRPEKAATQHSPPDSPVSPGSGVKVPGRKSIALEEAAMEASRVAAQESKASEETEGAATAPTEQSAPTKEPESKPAPPPAAAPAVRPAFKLNVDDFEFGRQLGEGSYARVVHAVRIQTGEEYAVKIMDKVFVRKQKKVKNVTVERNVLNILDHPNILKLMCTFQDPDSLYIVLEYAQGGELFQKIKGLGAVSVENARYWIAEIVNALQHMHSRGVLHRDLKPENILLCKEGHVKIGDFGSAKLVNDGDDSEPVDRSNTFCGTAEYVSPEMLKDMNVTESSDLWALGCTAYQLLAGIPPFKGQSEYLIFEKILERNFAFPEDFPELAKDFVEKLLVLDPAQRLGSGPGGYDELKSHPFFEGLDFAALERGEIPPPPIKSRPTKPLIARTGSQASTLSASSDPSRERLESTDSVYDPSRWERFLFDGETIVKSGKVTKLKAFGRSKIRQLILTSFPRLIYIDSKEMIQKGEIPWSEKLKAEVVNQKKFNVITPGRTYNLEDFAGDAVQWVEDINALVAKGTVPNLGISS